MIGSGNIHRCRARPFEASVYSLEAKSEKLKTLKANSKTELTLEVDKKIESSSLEIPVNFTREDVAAVRIESFSLSVCCKS